jgi:cyclase
MILDIDATVNNLEPDFDMIAKIASECQMPLCYGGGITNVDQAVQIIALGVEKVAISAAAIHSPELLRLIASRVGVQSVVVVLDVYKKPNPLKVEYGVCTHNGKKKLSLNLFDLIDKIQNIGVGEIVINSVDCDGSMQGYDLNLATQIKDVIKVPVTFLGGCGSLEHVRELISKIGIVGASAGSLFVFKGKYQAVLINYPNSDEKKQLLK